jgi:hypothetical protein
MLSIIFIKSDVFLVQVGNDLLFETGTLSMGHNWRYIVILESELTIREKDKALTFESR